MSNEYPGPHENNLIQNEEAHQPSYQRLYNNKGPAPTLQHIIAIRHAENEPHLENDRNQPLTREGEEQAAQLGLDVRDFYLANRDQYSGGVVLIRSNKVRVQQTSEICRSILESEYIPVDIVETIFTPSGRASQNTSACQVNGAHFP